MVPPPLSSTLFPTYPLPPLSLIAHVKLELLISSFTIYKDFCSFKVPLAFDSHNKTFVFNNDNRLNKVEYIKKRSICPYDLSVIASLWDATFMMWFCQERSLAIIRTRNNCEGSCTGWWVVMGCLLLGFTKYFLSWHCIKLKYP